MKYEKMVIFSTLNQMVNYIAIKEYGIKEIINLTMENNGQPNLKKFNYNKWDKNLEDILDERVVPKRFGRQAVINFNQLKDKLDRIDLGKKAVMWNITGGQRNFVMAIMRYVFRERKDKGDSIVYFEGNEEKFYTYDIDFMEKEVDRVEEPYPMNIPLAFKLMGIEVKNKKDKNDTSEYYKKFIEKRQTDREYRYYKRFYEKYMNNSILLERLIETNKDIVGKEKINDKIEWLIDRMREIDNCKELVECKEDRKTLRESLKIYGKRSKVFGYILEKIAFYKIIDVVINQKELMDNVADLDISVKIKASHKDERVSDHHIDEFDIVLLTKMGKIIIFECKSGAMTGDNAKSTHYSTYRVAGVYGTPVLINPITKHSEIKKYKNIEMAENAAKKAGLIICRMGNESTNITNIYPIEAYIKEVLKTGGNSHVQ